MNHEPTRGVSNTIDCSCGETFHGPMADDVEDLYIAHKLGPKYEALSTVLFAMEESDDDESFGDILTELSELLEENGWRFVP